jgi:hypothetical protein
MCVIDLYNPFSAGTEKILPRACIKTLLPSGLNATTEYFFLLIPAVALAMPDQ